MKTQLDFSNLQSWLAKADALNHYIIGELPKYQEQIDGFKSDMKEATAAGDTSTVRTARSAMIEAENQYEVLNAIRRETEKLAGLYRQVNAIF